MTEIDSAAFEAGVAPCNFTAGRIDSADESDAAHFSDALGRIYLTAQALLLSPRPQAGHTQPALTLVVEDSADGSSWATVATFEFTASDQQSAAVDSPRAYLRASWAGVVGTWAIDVAVKSIATPASGGGSLPDGWVDNGDGTITITGSSVPITVNANGPYSRDQYEVYDFDGNLVFSFDAAGGLVVDGSHGGQGSQYFATGDFGINRITLGDSARFEVANKDLTTQLYVIEQGDGGGVVIYGLGGLGLLLKGPHAAPPNSAFANGDLALWFDQTAGAAKLMIKAKDAGGTFRTAAIALS